jgi:hypothetical protein
MNEDEALNWLKLQVEGHEELIKSILKRLDKLENRTDDGKK